MTQPFTTAELDAMVHNLSCEQEVKEYVTISRGMYLRLIAAARVSIPRPIAEAPKDGTVVDMFYADGERLPDVRWFNDVEQSHWQYMDSVDGGWRKSYSHAKFVSFLPIPKGGAS